ncbi:MAG: preprotein translocase subunit SecG [Pseudomonadota bacterium]
MIDIVLIIHVLIAIALIGVVLLQRSEGGGLGIGGGGGGGAGGGMSGFLTGRGTANLLTRTTAALAACFMATSIILSILARGGSEPSSILDTLPTVAPSGQSQPLEPSADDGGEPASDEPQVPIQ